MSLLCQIKEILRLPMQIQVLAFIDGLDGVRISCATGVRTPP